MKRPESGPDRHKARTAGFFFGGSMSRFSRFIGVLLAGLVAMHAQADDKATQRAVKASTAAQQGVMESFMKAVDAILEPSHQADEAFTKKAKRGKPLVVPNLADEVIKVRDANNAAIAKLRELRMPQGLGPLADSATRYRLAAAKALDLRAEQYSAAYAASGAAAQADGHAATFSRLQLAVHTELAKIGNIAFGLDGELR